MKLRLDNRMAQLRKSSRCYTQTGPPIRHLLNIIHSKARRSINVPASGKTRLTIAAFGGSVSRLKIAFGLALVSGVVIWAATAFLYPQLRWRWLSGSGKAAIAQGRSAEAEKTFRTALDFARTIRHGELFVATSALDLAEALLAQGRPADVEPLANEAIKILESKGSRERLELFRALVDLAGAFKEQKRGVWPKRRPTAALDRRECANSR